MDGKGFIRHVVTAVNPGKRTADVRTVAEPLLLTRDVPWSALQRLDESQNAVSIVREATENK